MFPTITEQMLSTEQVAEHLQVDYRTVLNWIRAGKLPATKIGAIYRIDPVDLQAFKNRGRVVRGPRRTEPE